MKRFNDEAKYFRLGFQAELKARDRGIQTKLAKETGISRGLLCDLNKGRTRGAADKHRLLAKALGVKYEDLVERGLQIERKRLIAEVEPEPDFTGEDTTWEDKFRLAQKYIAAQEKIIGALEKAIAEMDENSRLRLEIEGLKRASQGSSGFIRPRRIGCQERPAMDSE